MSLLKDLGIIPAGPPQALSVLHLSSHNNHRVQLHFV